MKRWLAGTVLWALLASGTAAQDASLRDSIQADYESNLGPLFDHFHRNPELSGLEVLTAGVRGVYFAVGGTLPENFETASGHHSPGFRIEPEPAVTAGVEAMVLAGLELMPRQP